MMHSWWWLWLAFMIVFLATPMGYGWGYRGWGPPYPRYIQRRRAAQGSNLIGSPALDHHAWSWGGDLLWMLLLIWVFWAFSAIFWWP